jgi:hypothetical protein
MTEAIVKNSGTGIQTDRNFNYVYLAAVDFQNCGESGCYSINFAGPSTRRPWISNCTFNNCYGAVLAVNLTEVVIQNCYITNCAAGIYLSNIPQPYIISNNLSSTKKTLPGIFASSCNGLIRHNSISGHTSGIYLANSSPDIGDNMIEHNLYHGIYLGTGSKPDMHAELFTEEPEYYAISGYNTFLENGGTTQGGSLDNDGSEIYFSSLISNANMEKGCNSIIDDRSPGTDHPPYNTRFILLKNDLVILMYIMNQYFQSPVLVLEVKHYWLPLLRVKLLIQFILLIGQLKIYLVQISYILRQKKNT